MSVEPSAVVAAFVDAYNAIQVNRICQVATLVVVIYDHAITLDQEVQLIWKKKWTLLKLLFLVIRYVGDLLFIFNTTIYLSSPSSNKLCHHWQMFNMWTSVVVEWSMQSILQLRIYAVLRNSRTVLVAMVIGFTAEIATMTALSVLALHSAKVQAEPLPGLHLCSLTFTHSFYRKLSLPMMAYDILLFVLIVYGVLQHTATRSNAGRQRSWTGNPLIQVLFRDTVKYSFCTMSVNIAMTASWMTLPMQWFQLPISFAAAVTIILGTRLVLNLRESYYDPVAPQDSQTSTLPPPAFASRSKDTDGSSTSFGAGVEDIPMAEAGESDIHRSNAIEPCT